MREEKTLDLTGIRPPVKIRERQLADFAYDYWAEGLKLTKIILNREMYEQLNRELIRNNTYINIHKISKLKTINLGFGEVELEID